MKPDLKVLNKEDAPKPPQDENQAPAQGEMPFAVVAGEPFEHRGRRLSKRALDQAHQRAAGTHFQHGGRWVLPTSRFSFQRPKTFSRPEAPAPARPGRGSGE